MVSLINQSNDRISQTKECRGEGAKKCGSWYLRHVVGVGTITLLIFVR